MKAEIKLNSNKEVRQVKIFIGENSFRLTESIDGKLTINKHSYSEDDTENDNISVMPRYANEIELL